MERKRLASDEPHLYCAGIVTLLTAEWFFLSMDADVCLQGVLELKDLSAVMATEDLQLGCTALPEKDADCVTRNTTKSGWDKFNIFRNRRKSLKATDSEL